MQFQQFKKENRSRLPEKPGVYKFLNTSKIIIYVGKAKNLKKRVSGYFTQSKLHNRKTYFLVNEICLIECVIVTSEFDALLLENNLIKENQPKYNILLKDDKSFPSICITNERFPTVCSTRKIDPKKGEYFGPYTSVRALDSVLDLVRKLNKIRTCKYNLSRRNIEQRKFKVCLEYHIGNCLGPCEGLQSEEDYLKEINCAKNILKGKIGIVQKFYKEQMNLAASDMKFELAQDLKMKLELTQKFQAKTLIVNRKISNVDVFTIVTDEKSAFINFLKIQNGSIIMSETVEIKKKLGEADEEVLRFAIFDLQRKYNSSSKEILTNINVQPWEGVEIVLPQIGDKKKLIDLSLKNALFFRKEQRTRTESRSNSETLSRLMEDVRLPAFPAHIECFDNSNIQGASPVAAMVCFKNGKPSKSDYRKFNIKTVYGIDDFASMKEIVKRRYSRLEEQDRVFPNLIIIDGGKGQLNAASKALKELGIYGKIPIMGIAKRLEEIYFPEDEVPLHMSKKSPSLKLIQEIRNEAHRFAITFHRKKRRKRSLDSSIDKIFGIGIKTKELLLKKFKSVKRIKEAEKNELISLVGKSKARILREAIIEGKI